MHELKELTPKKKDNVVAVKTKQYLKEELPEEDEIVANLSRTQLALAAKLKANTGKTTLERAKDTISRRPEYYRYTPTPGLGGAVEGVKQRLVRVMEQQVDPLDPGRHRHKRAPRQDIDEPPAPVMHSPPKKLTLEDQQNWKIPPCVSNWKNPKGYTIPLDKRIAADGNSLRHSEINPKFAALGESLFTAEAAAREEIKFRNELIMYKKRIQEQQRESDLRSQANRIRQDRARLKQTEKTTKS